MKEEIIRVENLQKRFGRKVILDGVNIAFNKGECTAILGNNGTGKSTFLRMLCGLNSISCGRIIMDKKLKFNYIPENYSKIALTIDGYLKCLADIEKVDREYLDKRTAELYDKFDLNNLKDVPMKNLSKGSLQKAAILQAFIKEPDILLLDEPMTGLDVESQKVFIEEVKKMTDKGVTLIMSCHEPYLVSSLCSRVLKIKDKKIIESEKTDYEYVNKMIFKNSSTEADLGAIIGKCESYEIKDGRLYLEVKESLSKNILLEMLKKDYMLEKFD